MYIGMAGLTFTQSVLKKKFESNLESSHLTKPQVQRRHLFVAKNDEDFQETNEKKKKKTRNSDNKLR